MCNSLMPLLATFILLTLLSDINKAHSLDVESENEKEVNNNTEIKLNKPLLKNKVKGSSKFLETKDSTKSLHRDEATPIPKKEPPSLTHSVNGIELYDFLNSRYPKMSTYIKRLLQKTHDKLERKKDMLSNLSQKMRRFPKKMEQKMKTIFSDNFPFPGRVNDGYEGSSDDFSSEECCDHDDYVNIYEDEMNAYNVYMDHIEDYMDSSNLSTSNDSHPNSIRIDIINDHPYTSDPRIVISRSNNQFPYQSQQILSTNLRPNVVVNVREVREENTGVEQSDIAAEEKDEKEFHASSYF